MATEDLGLTGSARKILDVFRMEVGEEWRWTLTRSGHIVDSATESFKKREGVDRNILSALAIDLELVTWSERNRVQSRGTIQRPVFIGTTAGGRRKTRWETIHVILWHRP